PNARRSIINEEGYRVFARPSHMQWLCLFLAPALALPYVKQKPDFCGEACAEMALRSLGSAIDQDDAFVLSGVNPARGRGAYTKELKAALEKIGFATDRKSTRL